MSTKRQGFLVTIHPDGTEMREPFKGTSPPYERLRALVGGCLASADAKYQGRRRTGYVHDEGLLLRLPHNPRASRMYREAFPGMAAMDYDFGHLVGVLVLVVWETKP